nr:GON-4-like protein isoform X1 [Nothobranchius furzeri]XP_054596897.1 GON-4-like protein isoform X1 [Nothobranchius furzeri]
MVAMETSECSDDELGRLDIDLDRKSKRHNLTSSNVRAILHEVITHEHVVAMMKAAIRDTQNLPMFEPKMTRSRLKQAVQQEQVNRYSSLIFHLEIRTGMLTQSVCLQSLNQKPLPVNTVKAPQFVDINLEEDEDSSDEEYCPDEDEEEDTAEEMFLSDADSLASPPKGHLTSPSCPPLQKTIELLHSGEGHMRDQVTFTCTAPPQSSFLERLNAVEEELNMFNQTLDKKTAGDNGGGSDEGSSCLAFRTRSKRPLVDIPLDQLEAALLAPDITADMYDQSLAHQEEDRHWTKWLQGLMAPSPEDEGDDDDDPEYNFLEDLDEPDVEDYRTDRAVQITKKEVNELLEELFETLQEENVPAEDEEQEAPSETVPKFNVPQTLRFEAPLAGLLTERRQTVRKQYEALQQRRALQDTTIHLRSPAANAVTSVLALPGQSIPGLRLDRTQKLQLQQQVQQHVQLLTQVHLLSRPIGALNHEASLTKRYLEELQQFASCREEIRLPSSFKVCNLQRALDLLQEVERKEESPRALCVPAAFRRLLPMMTLPTSSHAFPLLPADTAWLFATRSIFLYPELLPVCSLDPALHSKRHRSFYTAGEDGLIVLGLKHFEGTIQSDQLISSYLLCKSRWNIRKHIREMSGSRAPRESVIKMFMTQGVVPSLPLACSRVHPEDQRPPVDRNTSNMPNWLKNSQLIIQKTRLGGSYPPSLPPGCSLRLHPYYINKSQKPRATPKRLFTLAHNASLLPLAKAPVDQQVEPISHLSHPSLGGTVIPEPPAVSEALPVALSPVCGSFPLVAVLPGPEHQTANLPVGQKNAVPLLLPLASMSSSMTSPNAPCSSAKEEQSFVLVQMMWTPPAPCSTTVSQDAPGCALHRTVNVEQPRSISGKEVNVEGEESSASSLSPLSSCTGDKEEEQQMEEQEQHCVEGTSVMAVSFNGGTGGGKEGGEGEKMEEKGGHEEEETGGEGEEEQSEEDGGREEGGEREEDGDKDQQGEEDEEDEEEEEEEEEEDFDDLTQDEDEEEAMSSASEESVLSVPELQETMKQLTWLAAERRLCVDGDSEDDQSPTSQEEEDEEEDGVKGEDAGDGQSFKAGLDEETPSGEGTPRGRRCPGRGRGRSRPFRGLTRTRQERFSKDAAKLLLLYDENILENDPLRESKDMAFAQSYLNRVREVLQDTPEQVEEFVYLLNRFEQVGEGQEVTQLFRKLRCILGSHTDLLRDFAAFLHPEQALQCGLFEEQQAFERSRRFLRQLEISFGDNPSHYQKIIKALQTGPDMNATSIQELKTQMGTLLKGHTHLQAEFWVFFDDLRPTSACPGQFEEAHWLEEGEGGEGNGLVSGNGASGSFEEVTLPELEEEEEGHKVQPMRSRRQRRKMDSHRGYKGSAGEARAMKSLNPLYSQISAAHNQPGDKNLDVKPGSKSPQPNQCNASWEGSFPLADDKEEDDEEEEELNDAGGTEEEDDESPAVKKRREELPQPTPVASSPFITPVSSSSTSLPFNIMPPSSSSALVSSPHSDIPVCAKNISLTASGEKVILWTREADRVILTMCQQEGANQNTFQNISKLLGNKTPNEVSHRFRDLMRLFRTAARHTSSEDEAPPTESNTTNDTED